MAVDPTQQPETPQDAAPTVHKADPATVFYVTDDWTGAE